MPKKNPDNLPSITPNDMVGMMMQSSFHKSAVTLTPFRGVAQNLNKRELQKRIENGEKVLQVWREYFGYTFSQMAKITGYDVATYLEIESENVGVPLKNLKQIVRSLKIHPAELYDGRDVCDTECVDLLVDAYNHTGKYVMADGEIQNRLIEALEDQADEVESYEAISEYYDDNMHSHKPHKQFVNQMLLTLLRNDGNPAFTDYLLPSEYVGENKEYLRGKIEVIEKSERAMQAMIDAQIENLKHATEFLFDDRGAILIEKWASDYESFYDSKDFHATFMSDLADCVCAHAGSVDIDEFFGDICQVYDGFQTIQRLNLEMFELSEKADAISEMQDDLGVALASYDNRQIILKGTNLMEPLGQPNHDLYIPEPPILDYKKQLTPRPKI